MNYWLHRISHWQELAYPLLERGILSIGWSDFSFDGYLEKCIENWDNFEECFTEERGDHPPGRYSLWRFISEMKKGDYVLVPSWGEFSIYKITDEKPFIIKDLDISGLQDWAKNEIKLDKHGNLCRLDDNSKEQIIDLGFFRKVEPVVQWVSRKEYADQALTSRMKFRRTNIGITDLKKNIEEAIRAFKAGEPINLQSIILKDSTERVIGLIREKLDAGKFEELIKWYFGKVGAVDVGKAPKGAEIEGDADVSARFDETRTMIYVQAKKHEGETDLEALKQIIAYKNSNDAGSDYSSAYWVISSADGFVKGCEEVAQENDIILIDGPEFAEMILKVGVSKLDGAF